MNFKNKKISVFILLIFLFSKFSDTTFAEPFYFHAKLINEIRQILDEKENFWEKIKYLDNTEISLALINNENKNLIIRDVATLKKDLIKSNIRNYTINKYFTGSKVEFIKKYKPFYLGLKNKDLTADIHINYLKYLEQIITGQLEINENDSIYKWYIYILYSYNKNQKNNVSTEEILNNIENFSSSNEFLQNKDYYKNRFDKLVLYEKFNKYSKNDFRIIKEKILKENISPNSDYVKWFLYWYWIYKNILTKNTITLKNTLYHEKQKYSLSCEANSARDLVNYYILNSGKKLIAEDEILSSLSSYTWWIIKNNSENYLWADPNKTFVWSFSWKQSINPLHFTWYWVYANPIIKSIKTLFTNDFEIKKDTFNEKNIVESILWNNPVMFWYLSEVKIWNKIWYQTKSITWETQEWNKISWYIWEHTWVIVWYDINNNWKITNIYYYEWRNSDIQKMDFNFAKQVASFFNETITIKRINSNSTTLVFNK